MSRGKEETMYWTGWKKRGFGELYAELPGVRMMVKCSEHSLWHYVVEEAITKKEVRNGQYLTKYDAALAGAIEAKAALDRQMDIMSEAWDELERGDYVLGVTEEC